jgi:hypothetical protein
MEDGTMEHEHEDQDLSERCTKHGQKIVSDCGRFDAPCSACEMEMEDDRGGCKQDDCETAHCMQCGCHMPFAGHASMQTCTGCMNRWAEDDLPF